MSVGQALLKVNPLVNSLNFKRFSSGTGRKAMSTSYRIFAVAVIGTGLLGLPTLLMITRPKPKE